MNFISENYFVYCAYPLVSVDLLINNVIVLRSFLSIVVTLADVLSLSLSLVGGLAVEFEKYMARGYFFLKLHLEMGGLTLELL